MFGNLQKSLRKTEEELTIINNRHNFTKYEIKTEWQYAFNQSQEKLINF